MSAQEELVALELDIRRSLPLNLEPEAIAHHVAKWLHKDGYRKPRTITTAEELSALPNMTVVRSRKGSIVNLTAGRAYIFGTEGSAPASSLALPVTVLHDPEADQ